jgi:hypothetical protein
VCKVRSFLALLRFVCKTPFNVCKSTLPLCIINLVHWQFYRVEKVGKYLNSLAKKTTFWFLHIVILGVILKKLFSKEATSKSFQFGQKSRIISKILQRSHLKILASITLPYSGINVIASYLRNHISSFVS